MFPTTLKDVHHTKSQNGAVFNFFDLAKNLNSISHEIFLMKAEIFDSLYYFLKRADNFYSLNSH